jgi:hypothetical protein
MSTTEQKRVNEGKPPTRQEKKFLESYEKDIKSLTSAFALNFIFVHMLFKKISSGEGGGPFVV